MARFETLIPQDLKDLGIILDLKSSQDSQSESSNLNQVVNKAVKSLRRYCDTSYDPLLREDQFDTIHRFLKFLESGETAGYLYLTTGYGKTIIAARLAEILGLNTVLLSPMQLILEQTDRKIAQFAPSIKSVNYYSEQKDQPIKKGRVFNTTYQSFTSLSDETAEEYNVLPEDVELIITDELHTATGEQRHKIFRKYPNALLVGLTATPDFRQIRGLVKRGLVKTDERWVGLVTNMIHSIPLEEGIEMGINPPIKMYLVDTEIEVENAEIIGEQYNQWQLEAALGRKSREVISLAIIAGSGAIPKGVNFNPETLNLIDEIHQEIKGQKTVVFGRNIKDIEDKAEHLRNLGIKAEALHYKKNKDDRQKILLEEFEDGDLQVILGVSSLGLGWDSNVVKVGIFEEPTISPVKLGQTLGRLTRGGKDQAIAIQLIDRFAKYMQKPLLLTDLFDHEKILRGTQSGEESSIITGRHRKKPNIEVKGINVKTLVTESHTRDIIRNRLSLGDIQQTQQVLDQLIDQIRYKYHDLHPFNLYKEIVEVLPLHIPSEKQRQAIEALVSLDTNIAEAGKSVLIWLNLKTIFSAAQPYLGKNLDENFDLIHSGIRGFIERAEKFHNKLPITIQIFNACEDGIENYLATIHNIPPTWVKNGYIKTFKDLTGLESFDLSGKTHNEIEDLILQISQKTKISEDELRKHLLGQFKLPTNEDPEELWDVVWKNLSRQAINKILDHVLISEEKMIIKMKFGLGGYLLEESYKEIARRLRCSPDNVRQTHARVIIKLSNWSSRTEELFFDKAERLGKTPEIREDYGWLTKEERILLSQKIGSLPVQDAIEQNIVNKEILNVIFNPSREIFIDTMRGLVWLSRNDLALLGMDIDSIQMLEVRLLKLVDKIGKGWKIPQSGTFEFPKILIENSSLPKRASFALQREGIKYMNQIMDILDESEERLWNVRGLGIKGIMAIREEVYRLTKNSRYLVPDVDFSYKYRK